MDDAVLVVLRRLRGFEREAHQILGMHESSLSRVVFLDETYKQLKGLSVKQDELFREALHCVENSLFRAAHVMAWAAFMDFLLEKLAEDGFVKLRKARAKWAFANLDELRESVPEHQLLEASREVGLCTKGELKALLGLLNSRNECAHPSGFCPGLNESLGYVSQLLKRLATLVSKKV
jgi:hypothetical protein